ncbi:myb-like protein Q [Sabethes cyaneus]|uniref:myb-like protein Q n=1 Tax=Sabethes cyaneus TaxID=53552 RepID=UPI00237D75EA|nr:myb-like protein Q [Sabethes cyaneus]XP_053687969.1 myb-like protein Q [Sabethes cyaneus]
MPGSGSDLGPSSSHGSSEYYRLRRHVTNGVDADDDGETGSIVPDRTGKHAFCRLCLTHSDKLRPLFPPDAAPDPALLAQISDCVEVQITLPEDIKSFICLDCVQQIYSFASFKELCKSNDQLLKSQTIARPSEDDDDDDDDVEDGDDYDGEELITPEVTICKSKLQPGSYVPDPTLLEKLLEQGVEVEAIGQSSGNLSESNQFGGNSEDREAERKAKNAARMRRWRMRQRQKQEQQLVQSQVKTEEITEQNDFAPQPVTTDEQEEALRIKQAQELFAFFAQHQLRQVEAEIRRLKESAQNQHQQEQQQPQQQGPSIKLEPPQQLATEPDQNVSRQSSPNSEKQMASLRRSRAEYMRKWRAKRQSQQNKSASFGLVGRPPVSPAQTESEKLLAQRNNRAEYMRRWRRERLKQELSPEEFDEWCVKSEQRRRFREWQVVRESASSTGDDTMDYGEADAEEKMFPFEASRLPGLGQS